MLVSLYTFLLFLCQAIFRRRRSQKRVLNLNYDAKWARYGAIPAAFGRYLCGHGNPAGASTEIFMRNILTALIAGFAGLLALGATAAFAGPDRSYQRDYRPDRCTIDHDHRSHAANYYDYYQKDRYYRAGPYRNSGVSVSFRFGNDGYRQRDRHARYDRYDRYDRKAGHDYKRRNGYRDNGQRIVNREVFDTRYRARIVLTERVVRGDHGRRLVCTVKARGPEADHVSHRRLNKIANRYCSPRARVRVLA